MSRPDFSQLQGYTTLSESVNSTTNPTTQAVTITTSR
jgi:hypothetical protein